MYAKSNRNFFFHITAEELCAFVAILVTSGYASLPRRWEQESNVFNCAMSDLLPRNSFEELLKYLHVADNTNLPVGDKIVICWRIYDSLLQ